MGLLTEIVSYSESLDKEKNKNKKFKVVSDIVVAVVIFIAFFTFVRLVLEFTPSHPLHA